MRWLPYRKECFPGRGSRTCIFIPLSALPATFLPASPIILPQRVACAAPVRYAGATDDMDDNFKDKIFSWQNSNLLNVSPVPTSARLAGTSVAVVSYVINNGPRPVAEKTRQRVLDAIQRIGYRPNGVARALALGSTKTFGLIVPTIANPFVASMAHVLLQESLKAGHVMLLGDAGEDRQREIEVIHALLNRQVDGLFYASVDSDPQIDLVKASGHAVDHAGSRRSAAWRQRVARR